MIPERQREALMRLTMCARDECMMCIYQPKDDRCKDIATRCMHILADALEQADTPQTEVEEVCDRADRNCNECWKQLHCRAKDTPQMERKSCTLELFDDDGNYIEPQTDCGWK